MYLHFHLNNENTYLYQILLHKHTNRFRFMLLNRMHVRSLHEQTLRKKKIYQTPGLHIFRALEPLYLARGIDKTRYTWRSTYTLPQ